VEEKETPSPVKEQSRRDKKRRRSSVGQIKQEQRSGSSPEGGSGVTTSSSSPADDCERDEDYKPLGVGKVNEDGDGSSDEDGVSDEEDVDEAKGDEVVRKERGKKRRATKTSPRTPLPCQPPPPQSSPPVAAISLTSPPSATVHFSSPDAENDRGKAVPPSISQVSAVGTGAYSLVYPQLKLREGTQVTILMQGQLYTPLTRLALTHESALSSTALMSVRCRVRKAAE
jgi:hypothetical protein